MFTLDISLDNVALYEGCRVHRFGVKRPRIDTSETEGFRIVQQNAERIFASHGFSRENKGDSILIAGSMLSWATAAVAVLAPQFFKEVLYQKDSESEIIPLFKSDNGATGDECPDHH